MLTELNYIRHKMALKLMQLHELFGLLLFAKFATIALPKKSEFFLKERGNTKSVLHIEFSELKKYFVPMLIKLNYIRREKSTSSSRRSSSKTWILVGYNLEQ